MKKKVIIVGGVAGGASAAARLRRLDEEADIILLEKGPYISYANCGLPYHVGGVIANRVSLLLQTPESFRERFRVDVRVNHEVLSLASDKKEIRVRGEDGKEYTEDFDSLILSPGSTPFVPPVEGRDLPGIFTLWTVPDTDAINAYIREKQPKRALVIGGGFIGLEMAENLVHRGLDVSLVEMLNQVMAPLDKDMAKLLENHMQEKGVKLYLGKAVEGFSRDGSLKAHLKSGEVLDTDLVILSIGVRAQTAFLKDSGIDLGPRGHILVNEELETSRKDIYAVGDAIEVVNLVSGQKTAITLAGPANKQGRMVAGNLYPEYRGRYRASQGTSVAKVFDLTAASTGLNEKQLKDLKLEYGRDYLSTLIITKDHAGYYPGAESMTLKMHFGTKDGKLYGLQGVGGEGVAKRIDVFSAITRMGGSVQDLMEAELAYAPPYNSAKDPLNMIGFTADNLMRGLVKGVLVQDLTDKDQILDVRQPEEVMFGTIPGAMNIPLSELRDRLGELDRTKEYVTSCAIGLRGYIAARILAQNGFKVKNMMGGYTQYHAYYCTGRECAAFRANEIKDSGEPLALPRPAADGTAAVAEEINVSGLQCPGPIFQVSKAVQKLEEGQILKVSATDPGFYTDLPMWCERTANDLISLAKSASGEIEALICKGTARKKDEHPEEQKNRSISHNKTMIVFSDDLDKAIASMIIANGAASMGRKVTMFFTFWGLNLLRRHEKVSVRKSILEKGFSWMMPRGTEKLGLSRMNFGGIGAKLIRKLMKDKNVDSLETLMRQALDNGVSMIACNMSMDLMGIKEEELIEGVTLGGVATYLGEAEEADTNLFI